MRRSTLGQPSFRLVDRATVLRLLLGALLPIAGYQSASAQSLRVAGLVTDQAGAAVANARVTLVDSLAISLRSLTSVEGRFVFQDVSPGPAVLMIEANGFAAEKRSLTVSPYDQFWEIKLRLPQIREQVTVTATRTQTRLSETAASVIVLGPDELKTTAALTLDDALRQVPGFSLFRRTSSRTANPTSQGVALRGLGASGASRALVLADGIPLNDPFGGWVYWDRIPGQSINQVEVLRGGASHLYGSSALGGVINISTTKTDANALSLETSYGNQSTPAGSIFLSGKKGDWNASAAVEIFSSHGYVPVAPDERGLVDTQASSRHAVMNLKVERWFGKYQHIFGSASFFGESRRNGTALQTNRTHIRQFAVGGEFMSTKGGNFSARGYGGTQVYDQTFSAIGLNRATETLTRVQRSPAQFLGFSSQWSKTAGKSQTMVAGFESQQVRGASDEIVFVNGLPNSLVGAGGRQQTYGAFVEDLIRVGPLFITAGARFDHWRNNNALSVSRPISNAVATRVTSFPDRTEDAFSPHVSAVLEINKRVSLLAAAVRAYRMPTLNELYRSFRVGNVLTLANENLRAEHLTGGEAGLRFNAGERLAVRGTFFWNEITNPIANVTVSTTPALITRQRQNLGRTRSRGVELEAEASLNRVWHLSAGYLLADASVLKFPANVALEGLLIPQVARHQLTFQARYVNPSLTVGLQGRVASSQFDDDQNLFRLGSYFTLDALVAKRISPELDVFFAAENLLNQRYDIGKTPVTTLGPPILVRAGLRLHLGGR